MKALILAGGFGTRLREITKNIPKAMVPIAGKPFLQHQIRFLRQQGLTEIVLAVHHMGDQIKAYFGNGKRHGVDITYSEEEIPLGTGGAIKNAQKYIGNERFLVLNGDTYTGMKLENFLGFHTKQKEEFSMAVTRSNEPEYHEVVGIENNKVVRFYERGKSPRALEPLINAGAYILEPEIFNFIETGKSVSLER
jgi:NDP-sugar pyrophosphorylase family protein